MGELQTTYLAPLDAALVGIYVSACVNDWAKLPPLARQFYAAGGTIEQLRGCLRHIIVLGGYGPCLAANLTLQKAKLLPQDTPAKIGGPPGDAFELVYTTVTNPVRRKVHSADPALGEWIRLHLYGDIYSSPGLDLRRKQLLMSARLAQANMGEQLFGHALAALRFGATKDELIEAVGLAFSLSPSKGSPADAAAHKEALKILDLTFAKFEKDHGGVPEGCPEPTIPDPSSLKIPELYLVDDITSNISRKEEIKVAKVHAADAGVGLQAKAELEAVVQEKIEEKDRNGETLGGEEVDEPFAWEAVDDRIDPKTGRWKESTS